MIIDDVCDINGMIEVDNLVVDGNIKIDKEYRNIDKNNIIPNYLDILPKGTIIPWMRQYIPQGWLICNGQIIDNITTPDLSNIPWNANNEEQPGLYIYGTDDTTKIGQVGGENRVILNDTHLPSHNHKLAMKYVDSNIQPMYSGFVMNVDDIIIGGNSNFIYSSFTEGTSSSFINTSGVKVKVIYIIKI